eukprot:CAMPEP_0115232114 /NCGR_PEP_ID=MMETSP0270-20121206/33594_1 /TAXON_ID=71861 /ORGANISM="Scrippsiella trochoidea, Strain CCMP3099" /LENGTH=133 /DNA_ID=CAMNT_0002646787 /DNA_START=72 /DNA_END=473 /DNA_ORIENTATION=-
MIGPNAVGQDGAVALKALLARIPSTVRHLETSDYTLWTQTLLLLLHGGGCFSLLRDFARFPKLCQRGLEYLGKPARELVRVEGLIVVDHGNRRHKLHLIECTRMQAQALVQLPNQHEHLIKLKTAGPIGVILV